MTWMQMADPGAPGSPISSEYRVSTYYADLGNWFRAIEAAAADADAHGGGLVVLDHKQMREVRNPTPPGGDPAHAGVFLSGLIGVSFTGEGEGLSVVEIDNAGYGAAGPFNNATASGSCWRMENCRDYYLEGFTVTQVNAPVERSGNDPGLCRFEICSDFEARYVEFAGVSSQCVYLRSCNGFEFVHDHVHGGGDEIHIGEANAPGGPCINGRIHRCRIHDSNDDGVAITGDYGNPANRHQNIKVTQNEIYGIAAHGVGMLGGCDDFDADDNDIHDINIGFGADSAFGSGRRVHFRRNNVRNVGYLPLDPADIAAGVQVRPVGMSFGGYPYDATEHGYLLEDVLVEDCNFDRVKNSYADIGVTNALSHLGKVVLLNNRLRGLDATAVVGAGLIDDTSKQGISVQKCDSFNMHGGSLEDAWGFPIITATLIGTGSSRTSGVTGNVAVTDVQLVNPRNGLGNNIVIFIQSGTSHQVVGNAVIGPVGAGMTDFLRFATGLAAVGPAYISANDERGLGYANCAPTQPPLPDPFVVKNLRVTEGAPWLDLLGYNINYNGGADATAQFNQALTDAAAKYQGVPLRVRSGIILCAGTLLIPTGVYLQFPGQGEGTLLLNGNPGVSFASGVQHCGLSGVSIQSDSVTPGQVVIALADALREVLLEDFRVFLSSPVSQKAIEARPLTGGYDHVRLRDFYTLSAPVGCSLVGTGPNAGRGLLIDGWSHETGQTSLSMNQVSGVRVKRMRSNSPSVAHLSIAGASSENEIDASLYGTAQAYLLAAGTQANVLRLRTAAAAAAAAGADAGVGNKVWNESVPIAVTGSRGSATAAVLGSLLAALNTEGHIIDSTTI